MVSLVMNSDSDVEERRNTHNKRSRSSSQQSINSIIINQRHTDGGFDDDSTHAPPPFGALLPQHLLHRILAHSRPGRKEQPCASQKHAMSEEASDDGGGDAVNELFKQDHGITQARRKMRKAEAKCRLMLKRALKQGDIRFCNSCVSSFANDGMLGLALVIVREVFEKGKFKPSEYSSAASLRSLFIVRQVTPPRYTLSNVINACIRCSEIDRALYHWKSLQSLGAAANEVIFENNPAAEIITPPPCHRNALFYQVTYTALFKGLCSANRLDDALAMLPEMQAAGLRPNDRTFSTLMRGCMRDARGDAAQDVLLQMQQNGVTPDGACLEYAIKALVYDGEMKAASKLCKLHARNVTAAAAVVLATGWAIAGKHKKAGKAAALASERLAPGVDAKLNPFKKPDAGSSHEMYSLHQANELQVRACRCRSAERIRDNAFLHS